MLDRLAHRVTISSFLRKIDAFRIAEIDRVAFLRGGFDVDAYDDSLYARLGVRFPPNIRNATPRRQAEYLAGRYLAGLLLSERGHDTDVATGEHRQPLWPAGVTGSITHSGSLAMVALADSRDHALLGIDFEAWLDPAGVECVGANVLDRGERDTLASGGWPVSRAWTLAFSAKESVFKALYPAVGTHFDFDQAKLYSVDWQCRRFSVRMRESLSETIRAGCEFHGAFRPMAGGIFTVVAVPRILRSCAWRLTTRS